MTSRQPPAQPQWCGRARQARLPELTLQRDKSSGKQEHTREGRAEGEGKKIIKKGFFWYLFSKPLTKTRFEVLGKKGIWAFQIPLSTN